MVYGIDQGGGDLGEIGIELSLVFFKASASMSMQRRPLAIISSVSIFLVERRRLADFRLGKSGGDDLIVNVH